MYDFLRSSVETMALNCLVFEKIAFLYFGDRQTNKQTDRRTDGQARCMKPLSLSQALLFTAYVSAVGELIESYGGSYHQFADDTVGS